MNEHRNHCHPRGYYCGSYSIREIRQLMPRGLWFLVIKFALSLHRKPSLNIFRSLATWAPHVSFAFETRWQFAKRGPPWRHINSSSIISSKSRWCMLSHVNCVKCRCRSRDTHQLNSCMGRFTSDCIYLQPAARIAMQILKIVSFFTQQDTYSYCKRAAAS